MKSTRNYLKKQYLAVAFLGIAGVTSAVLPYISTPIVEDKALTPKSDFNPLMTGKIKRTPKEIIPASYEIDLFQDNKLIFADKNRHNSYIVNLDIIKTSFARYNGVSVPKDLRQSAFIAQQATGVPHNVIFMIAKAESNFDNNSSNPYSTGQSYFHMLKDTTLAYIEKTKGTSLEHLFPLSDLIRKGQYSDGRAKMYMINEQTGAEDKALTYSYHKQVANNPYLSSILTGLKVINDNNTLSRQKIEPSYLDTYAQWFFGGNAGKRFALLRRSEPDAPIWRIYGKTQSEVEEKYKNVIENKGNKDFFFTESGEYKTVAQDVDYLVNTRGVSDTEYAPLEIDQDLAQNIRIQAPENNLQNLIAEWHKEHPTAGAKLASLRP